MIRTDLVPHPYFNVKSPDFYKKQKAMYELSRAKYKLVNQIRSGQEQELLQKQIEEIKRKQEAVNRFTKLKDTLIFQLDDENPRVYNEAGGESLEEEKKEAVEEQEEQEEEDVEDMTGAEMKKEIKQINNMIGRKDKASFIDTTPVRNLEIILKGLRNAKTNEAKKNILDVAKFEQSGKKASPKPKGIEEADPFSIRRPRPAGPAFLGDLGAAKRKLKKTEGRERPSAAGRPPSMLEELKAKQKTGLSKSKRAPVEKRKTSQEKLEEEISKVKLRRTKSSGKGISKKQKRVLFMGSAMAGNNNKHLLNKIMDI